MHLGFRKAAGALGIMSFLAVGPAVTKNDMKFSLGEKDRRQR
jgi:hypothetical protein